MEEARGRSAWFGFAVAAALAVVAWGVFLRGPSIVVCQNEHTLTVFESTVSGWKKIYSEDTALARKLVWDVYKDHPVRVIATKDGELLLFTEIDISGGHMKIIWKTYRQDGGKLVEVPRTGAAH